MTVRRFLTKTLLGFAMLLTVPLAASAQQLHRQTFEESETHLRLGQTNGDVRLLEHGLVTDLVHSGKQAERMVVRVTGGSYCFVEYDFGRATVFEELTISAYVYASRPGTRMLARVVLPNEMDPQTHQPRTVLLKSEPLEISNRWRKLVLREPDRLLTGQQQLLQAESGRPLNISDAYVDQVLFDIHSGIGDIEIRVDDLQIGPIVQLPGSEAAPSQDAVAMNLRTEDGETPKMHTPEVRDRESKSRAMVVADRLQVGGRDFFIRGIRARQAPALTLKQAGFNTIFQSWPVAPAIAADYQKLGMRTIPVLPLLDPQTQVAINVGDKSLDLGYDPEQLCVMVGENLDHGSENMVEAAVGTIRAQDPTKTRPIIGDVASGLRGYSRLLDMVGCHRYPLQTSLDFNSYRGWLAERRNIAQPGTLFWTLIQTHLDDQQRQLLYGSGNQGAASQDMVMGPQAEQIQLLTYASVAAGYRGVVFSSDRSLAEPVGGRARLLQLALLNLELMLAEPFLAGGNSPIVAKTSHPNVAAAIFRHERGVLVIPYWKDSNAQYVVGQAAVNNLQIIVENAPEAAQVYQVTLGHVRGIKRQKDLGGIRISVPEFDINSIIVLSTDTTLYSHYQELVQQISPMAAEWENQLAEMQLSETEQIHAQLDAMGNRIKSTKKSLHESHTHLEGARAALARRDYPLAVDEARRARRLSRLVRESHWRLVQEYLPSPVTDPYAVSYQTLPESMRFQAGLDQAQFSENRVPTGNFEQNGNLDREGWTYRVIGGERVVADALLVANQSRDNTLVVDKTKGQSKSAILSAVAGSEFLVDDSANWRNLVQARRTRWEFQDESQINQVLGNRALELRVRGKNQDDLPIVAVERTRVEMVSPPVPVRPGQVVRIRGLIKLPSAVAGSVDGAMVYDSLGGESLALRFKNASDWQKFVLYRPVNQETDLRVHLVMSGLGRVQFDDLQVDVTDNAVVPVVGAENPLLR